MEVNESLIQSKFWLMLSEKTLNTGRQLAVYGIPVISIITLIEFHTYHSLSLLISRLIALIPLTFFLFMAKKVYLRNPSGLFWMHLCSLSGIMLMVTGIIIIRLIDFTAAPAFQIASANGGLVTASFIVYLASAGVKRYLPYIFGFPFLLLLFYCGLIQKVDWKSLSLLLNPFITILGLNVFTYYEEKNSYQKFKEQTRMEFQKNRLEDEINQTKQLAEDWHFFATRDELTNLYNRRAALSILENHIRLAQKNRDFLTICFIDVDKLKKINDSHGHDEGDKLLKKVAFCLRENVRDRDYICRLGGDEFLVIFPSCNAMTADAVVNRIRQILNPFNIDFSYGFSEFYHEKPATAISLIRCADSNMYQHKLSKQKKRKPDDESDAQPPLFTV
jgi:diguanylate cyclase (GGDEF)-like protein